MMAPQLLLFLLLAAPAEESSKAAEKTAEKGDKEKGAEKDKDKDKDKSKEKSGEKPVVTTHEMRIGGRPLKYTVTAGMLPLKSEAGETEASVFFMAYVADRPGGPEKRPLTFSFNGGPGSSSV